MLQLKNQPRKWQAEAILDWKKGMSGIVKVVTGGGKTYFAMMCINEFFQKVSDGCVVIVVPTLTLQDQWYVSLIEEASVESQNIALFSGREKSDDLMRYNIMVINTAAKILAEHSHNHKVLLIVDECHRAGAEYFSRFLDGKWNATLGLSATPERQFDDNFEEMVLPVLGNVIVTYDYQEAFNDKVICEFELVNVKIPLTDEEQKVYDNLTRRAIITLKKIEKGQASEETLKNIYLKRSRFVSSVKNRLLASIRLVDELNGKRVLLFHEDISSLRAICSILEDRKVSVVEYHTRIGPSLRRRNLLLYRIGAVKVLGSCHALDEGFNVPETEAGIIVSSTSSKRQRIQRLGRMLRPAHNKKKSTIYTLYSTLAEEERLQKESNELKSITNVRWLKAHGI